MALYDLVRCNMPLPAEVTGVTEWRTRSLGHGFQTFEIDGEGDLRLFRLERRVQGDHPPRPALLDPSYPDWIRTWTKLEASPPAIQEFSGVLKLEGRDRAGAAWTIETKVAAGHCESFWISRDHPQVSAVAA